MRVCVTLLIFLGKSLFTLNLNSISTGFSLRFTAISTSQNTFNERVLNLSTLLSLYPIYHLPVFFRNCLERFSWIWRSMASTEPTSLHLFRGNYDIITCAHQNCSCYTNSFSWLPNYSIVCYVSLSLSHDVSCCHVVLFSIMTSIFVS